VNYARRLQIFADQAKDSKDVSTRGPLCFMLDLRGADSVRVLPPCAPRVDRQFKLDVSSQKAMWRRSYGAGVGDLRGRKSSSRRSFTQIIDSGAIDTGCVG
jgi:hypothetical protein